jgi:transcription elongation factor GreA
MADIFLTKDGFSTLENELKEIQKTTLPDIKRRMASAREDGDLSENNAWITAKEEMEITRLRISEIKSMLKTAILVEAPEKKSDVVQLGNTVSIVINGNKMDITLVPTMEADGLIGKLSIESPLGAALLGKKVGDVITFNSPAGEQSVEIKAKK